MYSGQTDHRPFLKLAIAIIFLFKITRYLPSSLGSSVETEIHCSLRSQPERQQPHPDIKAKNVAMALEYTLKSRTMKQSAIPNPIKEVDRVIKTFEMVKVFMVAP
ncbi:hypothetical protein DDN60_15555 [Vibrio cholerae]|nr:hypothetical protein [Vibrio cholerae]